MGGNEIGDWSLWLTTVAWLFISLVALIDASLEYFDEREEQVFARQYGTRAQRFLAHCRVGQAQWFMAGFGVAFLTGIVGGINSIKHPPAPDASLYTLLARILIIFCIFSFWRCKRAMRSLRKHYEEFFLSQNQESVRRTEERTAHIEHLTQDTNTEVHGISDGLAKDREEEEEAN